MKEGKLKGCLRLFLSFFRIGAFTFGGGYAMIPLIQKEAVEKRAWMTDDDILDIVAIAESTPGPIAINAATFIGSRVAGFWGALCATLGVVLPSFAIILAISFALREFADIKPVKYAFMGIRAGVLALIIKALITMYKKCPKNAVSYIVIGASFVLAAFVKAELLLIISGCAVFGLISFLIAERRNRA
ncbi:MAG: chromate transporter [Ruminococcaceae bacterium]|nr:chromate transporter [Oscillospiraceae bacterium]